LGPAALSAQKRRNALIPVRESHRDGVQSSTHDPKNAEANDALKDDPALKTPFAHCGGEWDGGGRQAETPHQRGYSERSIAQPGAT